MIPHYVMALIAVAVATPTAIGAYMSMRKSDMEQRIARLRPLSNGRRAK